MEQQTPLDHGAMGTAVISDDPSKKVLFNHALKSGAILGLIGIVLTLIVYVVDLTLLADWKFGIFSFVIFIGALIYAGINLRNSGSGYISYGSAFLHGVATLIVGGLIGITFNIILYNVIDPSLPQYLTEAMAEKTADMMRSFGANDEVIDEAIEKMKNDSASNFTPAGQLKTFGIGLIAYVIISAITSLFVKRSKPVTF